MTKISDFKTAEQIEEESIQGSPEVRHEVERTALANGVAIRIIRYRADNHLSQTELARQLGMHQSSIARLEAGDHEPSLSTLGKLTRGLGIEFHIDVTRDGKIKLRPEESDTSQQDERPVEDVLHVYLETVKANMRVQLMSQSVLESVLLLWPSHGEASLLGPHLPRLQQRLVARRAREEEDEAFLADLGHLLNDKRGLTSSESERTGRDRRPCEVE